jgi:uncharacterized damage-inducible protein DinB
MMSNSELRNRLVKHLKGGEAYAPIDQILDEIPYNKLGEVVQDLPYTFFQLFWHIRHAQLDILEYCRDENYEAPDWPEGYWPDQKAPESRDAWEELIESYFQEREELCDLILDTSKDLFGPLPSNPDHHLFREAELVIEHTSYHTGQLYMLYRLL